MTGEKNEAGETEAGCVTLGEADQAVGSATVLGVGARLKLAREAKGLTAPEAAKMLKLSPRQVEFIENDDWNSLPCTTIVRGFVRNYARLVGLDPEPLMQELDRVRPVEAKSLEMPSGTPVSMRQERSVDRRDFVRIAAGLVILLAALGTYFFVPDEMVRSTVEAIKAATQSRPAVTETRSQPNASDTPAPGKSGDASPLVPPSPVVLTEPVAPVSAASPTQAPSSAPAPAPAPAPNQSSAGSNSLRFVFSKPSWVEVRDRTGQTIFSQLSPGGSERTVEGTPPFNVVIGNAVHVTLTYKGQNIDLSKRSKDDVARLTLE